MFWRISPCDYVQARGLPVDIVPMLSAHVGEWGGLNMKVRTGGLEVPCRRRSVVVEGRIDGGIGIGIAFRASGDR